GGRQDGASRVFVTKTLRLVVWLMFHVWVKDANTPFRLMNSNRFGLLNVFLRFHQFQLNISIPYYAHLTIVFFLILT
ncbi:MAG: hypothetical protein J5870_02825, partial [Clostridia bacterium]|nr:hypothetical protein [Clostridia bacterium]